MSNNSSAPCRVSPRRFGVLRVANDYFLICSAHASRVFFVHAYSYRSVSKAMMLDIDCRKAAFKNVLYVASLQSRLALPYYSPNPAFFFARFIFPANAYLLGNFTAINTILEFINVHCYRLSDALFHSGVAKFSDSTETRPFPCTKNSVATFSFIIVAS